MAGVLFGHRSGARGQPGAPAHGALPPQGAPPGPRTDGTRITDMPYTPVAPAESERDTRSVAEGTAAAPKLTRSIGVVGGTLLTLSCLTPASSLFVIVPDSFASLG